MTESRLVVSLSSSVAISFPRVVASKRRLPVLRLKLNTKGWLMSLWRLPGLSLYCANPVFHVLVAKVSWCLCGGYLGCLGITLRNPHATMVWQLRSHVSMRQSGLSCSYKACRDRLSFCAWQSCQWWSILFPSNQTIKSISHVIYFQWNLNSIPSQLFSMNQMSRNCILLPVNRAGKILV